MKKQRSLTLSDFEDYMGFLWKIVAGITISMDNITRLSEKKYEYEDEIKNDGFFKFYLNQMIFYTIIQVDKLFSKSPNQKISFFKIFEKIEKNRDETFNVRWNKNIELNKFKSSSDPNRNIESDEQLINFIIDLRKFIESKSNTLDQISKSRNKVYAHTDTEKNLLLDINLTTSQLGEIVKLGEDVFKILNSRILGISSDFDHNFSWSIDPVLKRLSRDRSRIHDDFNKMRGSK